MRVHGVPGAEEDDVAHKDLVFECGTEMAFGFRERLFYLPSYAGDGTDGGALKFGDLERCGEHIPYERCVSEDLVWISCQLQLLHDLRGLIHAQHYPCGGNPEASYTRRECLKGGEPRIGGAQGAVERRSAVHMFGGVLQQAISNPVVGCAVEGECLKAAPTEREN